MDKMTHGSLFSGRGGFDLGAESCGIENIWNCEIDRWLRHKLKRISPNAKQYSDIRTVKFPKCPTVLSVGFPCQDISVANTNSKKGIKGTRSGLWFETERIIDEAKPPYILLENSPNLANKGFEYILSFLSKIGYDAEWDCFQGSDFGFPTRRKRLFIVAYPSSFGLWRRVLRSPGTYELSRTWTPTETYLSVSAGRKNRFRNIGAIQRGDVVHNFRREIHAFGNAVMPVIAEHLFRCIQDDYKLIKT